MSDEPHILVVDDHRDIRDALGKYLARNGYRVSQADSAGAARRVLRDASIDLCVLDIMMPGESDAFAVETAGTRVTALGTKFGVRGEQAGADLVIDRIDCDCFHGCLTHARMTDRRQGGDIWSGRER